jgi:hypothetical protein
LATLDKAWDEAWDEACDVQTELKNRPYSAIRIRTDTLFGTRMGEKVNALSGLLDKT